VTPTHDLAGVKAGLSDKSVERGYTLYSVYLRPRSALVSGESGVAGRDVDERRCSQGLRELEERAGAIH